MRDPEEVFIRIVEAVEQQGGELLNKTHVSLPIMYETKGRHGRLNREAAESTGCGEEALVKIPYAKEPIKGTPVNGAIEVKDGGVAEFCIICDMLAHWPRFSDAVKGL